MLRLAISSVSSNLFFLILLMGIVPFDRWRKPRCVKGRQNYPARSLRWLARKIFFWPISGTDFDTSGTRLVRKSAQGLFSPWNKLSRQNCRSPESIASPRLVAPGSPRMPSSWLLPHSTSSEEVNKPREKENARGNSSGYFLLAVFFRVKPWSHGSW